MSQTFPQKTYEVSLDELPLACPRPADSLWNQHPRVYLPILKTGRVICPYCGTEYLLKK